MQSDAELIEKCLRGDDTAWHALVERYGRLVYSIPGRIGLSAADADDVFQVVFGIVLRRLETLRDQSRLSAWLIRTTYREAWRTSRRSRGMSPLAEDATDPPTVDEPAVEREEEQQLVRMGLAEIDERCRTLLTALFYTSDTPDYGAIASKLDMPIGSIGPTRARCFKKLESILRKLGLS